MRQTEKGERESERAKEQKGRKIYKTNLIQSKDKLTTTCRNYLQIISVLMLKQFFNKVYMLNSPHVTVGYK